MLVGVVTANGTEHRELAAQRSAYALPVLAVAFVLGCSSSSSNPPALDEPNLPVHDGGGVLPAFHAVTGCPLFRAASSRTGVLGHDGSRSLSMGGDASQWFFTDTFFGDWNGDGSRNIEGGVHTSTAVVATSDLDTCFANATYLGGKPPEELVVHPSGEDTSKILPIVGAPFFTGAALWTYYAVYRSIGPDPLDLQSSGTGVLKAEGSPARFVRPSPDVFLFAGTEPTFGDAVLPTADAVYVYGGRPISAGVYETVLARVAPSAVTDRASYEFFAGVNGTGGPIWSADSSTAVALYQGGINDVTFNPHLNAYLATYITWFGQVVAARTAPNPWGPWSSEETIVGCYPEDPNVYCYEARQHPELGSPDGTKIVLSYDTNATTFAGLRQPSHSAVYWPRLVEVTFTK